jgi:hypothetical protein
MARNRNNQKQQWLNRKFNDKLLELQGIAQAQMKRKVPIAEITEKMLKCPSFKDVEKEIIESQAKINLKIKLDKKNLFK